MKQTIERVTSQPFVAHWIRAINRYLTRLGIQSAAAITYFSVLAMLPVLMVGFALIGLTLTVIRPDLLELLKEVLVESLADATTVSTALVAAVEQATGSWRTLGIIGLATAAWIGAKWVDHLKNAVRMQLRADANARDPKARPWIEVPLNLAILIALLLFVVASFAVWIATNVLTSGVLEYFGVEGEIAGAMWGLIGIGTTLVVTYLLFLFFFRVFPKDRLPWGVTLKGALLGAIGTTGLQTVASLLFGSFSRNAAAAVFGPVIVLMLFFNLFAQIIIITAAWIGTADGVFQEVGEDEPPVVLEVVEPVAVPAATPYAPKSPVAAGYLTGAATGLGIGALTVMAISRRVRGERVSREAGRSRRASLRTREE